MANFPDYPLAELHAHLGTSISPSVLWQIAHEAGIKLPKNDFDEFSKHITLSVSHKQKLESYFREIYHPLLDRLSSGALAVEQATYHTMASAYRSNITLVELRNNPMKHNRNAEFDMDYIIMAMLRGMERALLECSGLSAGLIFCMAREFPLEQNEIIVEKAIKYRKRGVVGIDVAGPASPGFRFKDYGRLFDKAQGAGLKVTVHSGETTDANDIKDALTYAKPARIGHGIHAFHSPEVMQEIAKRKVVLEVCPMSNLVTKAVKDLHEIKIILRTLVNNKISFCINTDWPEVIEGCHLRQQYAMLLEGGLLSEDELKACTKTAFESSFIPKPGGLNAYL